MKVRRPKFDFSDALPDWCIDREFGATWNASSMMLPTLEPFMNKVVMRVRNELDGEDARTEALKEELAIFVGQEGVHYQIHHDYNQVLIKRYPRLADFEEEMRSYYAGALKSKSMRWLTGFGQTFEMFGPIYACMWLDDFDDILERSQPVVVNMWKWHWAEEYEHRTSLFRAHNLYNSSYAYRMKILVETMRVLKDFQYRMLNYMLEMDRGHMSQPERRQSIANQKRWARVMGMKLLPPLTRAVLPFHSPEHMPEPRGYRGFMDWFESSPGERSTAHFTGDGAERMRS